MISVHHRLTALVALLALAIRLHGLDAQSLFMDEIRQVEFYHESFSELARRAMLQQQPPLDYWIGQLVFQLSGSDFALRLPAALLGAGTVVVLVGVTRQYARAEVALLAGLVLALLPFHVYYSQEARPYAIAIFLFVALIRVLQWTEHSPRPTLVRFAALSLASSLFLLSRTLSPLVVVVTLMAGLTATMIAHRVRGGAWRDRTACRYQSSIGAFALSLAVYLPVLGLILRASQRYAPNPTEWNIDTVLQGFERLRLGRLGEAYLVQTEPLGWWLLLPSALAPLAILSRPRLAREPILWLIVCTLPGALLLYGFVFHAKTHFPLRPAYLIFVLPSVLVLSAVTFDAVLDRLSERAARWALGLVAATALTAGAVSTIQLKMFHDKTDWRGLARHLESEFGEDHLLLFDALIPPARWDPEGFGLKRYYRGTSKRLSLKRLPRLLAPVAHIPVRPVLVVFRYRDRFLTPRSKYPVHPVPAYARGPDLQQLETDPRLRFASLTGFVVVSLESTTGRLAHDTARLLEVVADALEPAPRLYDLYNALAAARASCGIAGVDFLLEQTESWTIERDGERYRELAASIRAVALEAHPNQCGG